MFKEIQLLSLIYWKMDEDVEVNNWPNLLDSHIDTI